MVTKLGSRTFGRIMLGAPITSGASTAAAGGPVGGSSAPTTLSKRSNPGSGDIVQAARQPYAPPPYRRLRQDADVHAVGVAQVSCFGHGPGVDGELNVAAR